MSAFAGFPPDAWAFLVELEADNSKVFFDANRHRYDEAIAAPSKALVNALGDLLPDRCGLDVRAEPTVGRSLFRINRDTRFASDKTPYKTHLDFLFWIGDGPPRTRPAFIMRLTARSVLVGGGRMGVTGRALDTYRGALDDPQHGLAIRTALDTLADGGAELSDPDRARPPRPFPPDHPNTDLLRRDGFHLTRTTPHPALVATPTFADWCTDALEPFAPIVAWFSDVDR
ncbi:MAG: TIGR02453 family protein [Ilumatobacteraceae bacterium]